MEGSPISMGACLPFASVPTAKPCTFVLLGLACSWCCVMEIVAGNNLPHHIATTGSTCDLLEDISMIVFCLSSSFNLTQYLRYLTRRYLHGQSVLIQKILGYMLMLCVHIQPRQSLGDNTNMTPAYPLGSASDMTKAETQIMSPIATGCSDSPPRKPGIPWPAQGVQ